MSKPTHPALEALILQALAALGQNATFPADVALARKALADALPQARAYPDVVTNARRLLAERDELRAALEEIDTMDKEDAPRAAMARTARAALAKGES